MIKIICATVMATAGLAAPAIGVAQPVGPAPPPFVYYVVPCGSPGAIAATPALPPSADPALPAEAVCVVPVATDAAPPPRPRYSSYAYDPWGPNYYSRPFYGSFGLSFFSGGHRGGGHFNGGHSSFGHGGGGHFGGGHGGGGRSH
ncbi:putative membrane protein YgcG [Phenylobacterium haematophilum]|uniref:Putative membrane protein YgcG n=1 Tax=Phenylobacterium haematophilum TaxID=98513 RepID=A0A840A3N5_9CAUL|nr:hypothetical protein [Phenylobacterium haematophilum]MBB3892924.1 putative membrane protein YgcG [Phenylobacterium haematophilum]